MKTRFNKPFESVQVKIPYEAGMDPYSGLVDLCEKKGLLVKEGNRLICPQISTGLQRSSEHESGGDSLNWVDKPANCRC